MTLSAISLSLADALRDANETRSLEIGVGALAHVPRVFQKEFGFRPAVIIADANTFAVAGKAVQENFAALQHECLAPFVFREPGLYAEHSFVVRLEAALKQHQAIPVAVGAGTINDLVKLASHRAGRQYLSVATAASMDGYTAFGASITHQGSKQTFNCPAPAAVVADLDLIRSAPPEMNASGYADLLAKTTAGADWILADALGAEPIEPHAWNIVQGSLRQALANPAGVRSGDIDAVRQLVEGLMFSGLAMQSSKSSRPASGAEHQFSHLWDMQHHTHNGAAPSHGFKVGIGTLAVTALYEWLFRQPLDRLDVAACCARWLEKSAWESEVRQSFGEGELLDVAMKEMHAKMCDVNTLRAQLERLRFVWPGLREKLRGQLLPLEELKQQLQTVGAPVEPEQIGISRKRLRQSYRQAFFIRRRFTLLDFAVRADLLDRGLDEIFGPQGIWPTSL